MPEGTMSQLNEDERAELVAYLDGELNEEAAQVLEARLSREPDLRAEAEALKRTWELLDYLPRPEPPGGSGPGSPRSAGRPRCWWPWPAVWWRRIISGLPRPIPPPSKEPARSSPP